MPKPFIPSEEQRRQVKALVGFGLTHEQVCRVTYNPETCEAIDKHTLYKHFAKELATGHITAVARVAESLFKIATEGEDERTRMAAACFWLARRGGWTETHVNQIIQEDGSAVVVDDVRERISAKIARIHQKMADDEGNVTDNDAPAPYLAALPSRRH